MAGAVRAAQLLLESRAFAVLSVVLLALADVPVALAHFAIAASVVYSILGLSIVSYSVALNFSKERAL
jgi:hypothetical protein